MDSVAPLHPALDRFVDPLWYRREHPAASTSDLAALDHFAAIGWREGLSPHPLFDLAWYRRREGLADDVNPLLHFFEHRRIRGVNPHPLIDLDWCAAQIGPGVDRADALDYLLDVGLKAGSSPHPLFDADWYRDQVPHADFHYLGLFGHYLTDGVKHGVSPHPLFDPDWYGRAIRGAPVGPAGPLAYYVEHASAEGAAPHPLFDPAWYARRYPEAASAPLLHFVLKGASAGASPHPLFDAEWYASQATADAVSGAGPFMHYLSEGSARGLAPHPLVSVEHYRRVAELEPDEEVLSDFLRHGAEAGHSLNPLISIAHLKGVFGDQSAADLLTAFVEGGDAGGVSPHPLFSPSYYLAANPGASEQGVAPFRHYWTEGRFKGLETHPLLNAGYYIALNPDAAFQGALQHYLENTTEGRRHPHPLIDGTSLDLSGQDGLIDLALEHGDDLPGWKTLRAIAPIRSDGTAVAEPRGRVSIILAVSPENSDDVADLVDAVRAQTWGDWRLILVESQSLSQDAKAALRDLPPRDARILKLRPRKPATTGEACNLALDFADGDFVLIAPAVPMASGVLRGLVAAGATSGAAAVVLAPDSSAPSRAPFRPWSRLSFLQQSDAETQVLFRRGPLSRQLGFAAQTWPAAVCDAVLRLHGAGETIVEASIESRRLSTPLSGPEALEINAVVNRHLQQRGAGLRVDEHARSTPRRLGDQQRLEWSMDLLAALDESGDALPRGAFTGVVGASSLRNAPGSARALADAVTRGQGEIVIVVDGALSFGDASWTDRLGVLLRDRSIGLAGAPIAVRPWGSRLMGLVLNDGGEPASHVSAETLQPLDGEIFAPDPMLVAMRRNLFEELGGLDADFDTSWWSLVDLAYRAARAGYRNIVAASIEAEISAPNFWSEGPPGLDRMLFHEKYGMAPR